MWKRFLFLSRIQQIAVAVCFAHLAVVAALSIHHLATRRLRPAKPIAVRTLSAPSPHSLVTMKEAPAPAAKKEAPPKKPAPKPEIKPAAKPETKKESPKLPSVKEKAIAKKPVPQPAFQKEKESVAESQKALADFAESLHALSEQSGINSSRTSLDLPSVLTQNPLKNVSKREKTVLEEANSSPSYEQFLISYLQSALELPEYGEVKIEIEIDRFGNPLRCSVLESRSSKNGEFLKKRLPELSFPCFNDFGITDLTLTFTIAFRNVEIH